MSITPGRRFGAYEILSSLGSGGMGRVYLARDTRLDREVALKVLHEEIAPTAHILERFRREARSASNLNHPNIVTVYEIGSVDDTHFIAMEYLEGERLRDVIRDGKASSRRIVEIAEAIATGLAAAHERNIIHRDLKPENVIITNDGFVKLLDFGLAKAVEARQEPISNENPTIRMAEGYTMPGTVVGTPHYMSPEQVRGESLDHRSDQFSFGIILYEMLTGRRPFDRDTSAETMTAILRDEPPPVESLTENLPPGLVTVIRRCLEKEPSDRYESTARIASELREIGGRDSLPGTPVSRELAPERRQRFPWMHAVAATLAAVALFALFQIQKDPVGTTGGSNGLFAAALPAEKFLAVAPFEELGGDGNAEWALFARGMSETVSARLMDVPSLQVIPPSLSAGVVGNPRELAMELGANLVLTAALRRAGEQIRVNYALLDPGTGAQIAAGIVNGTVENPFLLEDRLADSILHSLQLNIIDGGSIRSNQGLLSPEAQDEYLIALGALQRYDDVASVEQGVEILERLRESQPQSALLAAALGRGYLHLYNLTSAPEWIDHALELSREAIGLNPGLPESHITYGEALTATGEYQDAILRFEQALDLRPNSAEATLGMAEAWDRMGNEERAEEAYQTAIELRPSFWGGYNKMAVFHLRRGRLDEAIPWLEKVVQLSAQNVRGRNNLGAIYLWRGNFERAAELYRQSLQMTESVGAWSNLGTSLYFQGEFDEAAAAYSNAVDMAPQDHVMWINLGDAQRFSERSRSNAKRSYERAASLARAALSERSADPLAHLALGYALAKLGRSAEARVHVARAVALRPDDMELLRMAGVAEAVSGRNEEAIALFERYVTVGGHSAMIESDPELESLRSELSVEFMQPNRSTSAD